LTRFSCDAAKVIGEAGRAGELFSLLDTFNPDFEIVEPKK